MKILQFNQDASCCVISPSDDTVNIYNCDPFGKCFEFNTRQDNSNNTENTSGDSNSNNMMLGGTEDDEGNSIDKVRQNNTKQAVTDDDGFVVEMLFSTSLVAICDRNQGPIKSKRLKIVNTKRKTIICELVFPHEIVDVAMNRKRMCILLENEQIFIYDISCMKPLETIDLWETPKVDSTNDTANSAEASQRANAHLQRSEFSRKRRNSLTSKIRPRIVLSNDDRSILCYTSFSMSNSKPGSYLIKDIVVYDALNVKPINYINNVHKGNISCLAINHDGKLIATASEKGTIVRVFSTGVDMTFTSNKQLQYEFRRGTRPSNIYQLIFNKTSTLVGCVGDTDTIHLFSLTQPNVDGYLPVLENGNSTHIEQENNEVSTSSLSSGLKNSAERPKQFASFLSKKIKASISNQSISRDFAHINVKENTKHCIGFPNEYPKEVYVIGNDGMFLIYAIPSSPGECILSKSSTFV
ncbi:similar to Saccharomyces cerevisiae YPL100W ATG21 Phosphoinositide binding protein required for vesicle formation in the cytoplasm-to-vacuole targeting (Cvt) pathway [Maudiozyma saulgeensis]|uniref:Similar to Saccharomyces cerevisiae YPL100W ATG21 Phosphoinositide binding protein required for vesicle formation in the cytoplasm-to-vacuole targeting (Cvt) pathway n=1 Tax=Maudiozyma saulgeensis TaxID=1789683 RepID=A0A1X7R674_9SACH|nr:similar to Saccharomyces cerevisiae YPL100W ATG21 Phosphoinositide binding protein required for vesicle formation in the cytoplasm-to-vacuole targeting (Cvt) pathway [Kazachstania saulgeensis]